MKKLTIIIPFIFLVYLLIPATADAQRYKNREKTEEKEESEKDTTGKENSFLKRLTYGGNFGLSIGSTTYIDISPTIGYRFTDKFISGIGFSYIYASQKWRYPDTTIKVTASNYGGRFFSQYFFFRNLLAHGEIEAMSIDEEFNYSRERELFVRPLIGAGYRSMIGKRSYFSATLLYDPTYHFNSARSRYYDSPIVVRVGFML